MLENVTLHYLGGKIYLEVKLPVSMYSTQSKAEQLHSQLQGNLIHLNHVAAIEIFYTSR